MPRFPLSIAVAAAIATTSVLAAPLESTLGRNETRVLSAPYRITMGRTVEDLALDARLERLHYARVRTRPEKPGEYFHGTDVYWFHRRACHAGGSDHLAELIGLALDAHGGIVGVRREGKPARRFDEGDIWLEPEVLSESLRGDRADRVLVALDALPESVWRPVLAAEDARFFEHGALDARALARAAWRNLHEGRVTEGGSTITQQLIKNRDLTPQRSLGRKASEAMRAVSLESEYGKKEILQAYLNTVYYGHVDGLGVYGFGAAAGVYFAKPAAKLSLAEAATLAAMIQGPNRLSPLHDAKALRERRDWVLSRMEELGWASGAEVARAKRGDLGAKIGAPRHSSPTHLLSWVTSQVEIGERERAEKRRGFLVETTIDPLLQAHAENAVTRRLAALQREFARLHDAKLSAALVALDARTGAVLAYVGGDPDDKAGAFDRARSARRQPGSVVKPFVVLEALDSCGQHEPLTASSRILDTPVRIDRPSGPWEPQNFDREFHGPVLLREALAESRNVPAVRIARHCGFEATAAMFERLGFELPPDPPPSFVLGAVETSPLWVARAYTVFATPGRLLEPFSVARLETASGGELFRKKPSERQVASPSAAYIVHDLLRTAVEEGTAAGSAIAGLEVAAKTGTSSELRDAWFAGQAGSIVAVAWVGLDASGKLGLTGAVAAGPLWREFVAKAAIARPAYDLPRPRDVVSMWVQESSGLLVRDGRPGAREELYRRGTLPKRKRWWRIDRPMPVIE